MIDHARKHDFALHLYGHSPYLESSFPEDDNPPRIREVLPAMSSKLIRLFPPLVLISTSCFVPASAIADVFEILSNGGFETGNLSGWIETNGQGHVVSVKSHACR